MTEWLDASGRCFNPDASVTTVPLWDGHRCYVIDDALAHPDGMIAWGCGGQFAVPDYPYPGLVLDAPLALAQLVADHFSQQVRNRLGGRRLINFQVRLSLVTTPPAELAPIQWQCHRDRLITQRDDILRAASVLYLFRDPAQGGTSFYRPRQSEELTDRMLDDSTSLSPAEFSARYGLQPGYMGESNPYFERVAQVPARWNRMIVYDGGLFHSADLERFSSFSADPRVGRLTLNGFYNCRRNAR